MSTELVVQPAKGLSLATFDDAFRFAKMVSASEFAPKDFRGKPESCLLAIQHGSEVGLSPMQSLQSIAVINGRPAIWGDAALALVQASAVCEYVYESIEGQGDNLTAVCECKRRGYPKPTSSKFSMADAKRAGLAGKAGPWTQYPERMLALRARGFALRNAFADVLRGLITAEEAADYPQPASPPVEFRPAGVRQAVTPEPARLEVRADPEDRLAKARLAINAAKSTKTLDQIAKAIKARYSEGVFTDGDVDHLLEMCNDKSELLRGDAYEEVPA
jgi:hypothetical protein